MQEIIVKFVGNEPKQASEFAAGFDVYAAEDIVLLPGDTKIVKTGTFIEMPENCEGLLQVRSGLASKGIMLSNGTGIIDSDYRGELGVILFNSNIKTLLYSGLLSDSKGINEMITDYQGNIDVEKIPGTFKISKGERIGQLRVREMPRVSFIEVEALGDSVRGEGGFGSTGTV